MFSRSYFGGRYFSPRYFGDGGTAAATPRGGGKAFLFQKEFDRIFQEDPIPEPVKVYLYRSVGGLAIGGESHHEWRMSVDAIDRKMRGMLERIDEEDLVALGIL